MSTAIRSWTKRAAQNLEISLLSRLIGILGFRRAVRGGLCYVAAPFCLAGDQNMPRRLADSSLPFCHSLSASFSHIFFGGLALHAGLSIVPGAQRIASRCPRISATNGFSREVMQPKKGTSSRKKRDSNVFGVTKTCMLSVSLFLPRLSILFFLADKPATP